MSEPTMTEAGLPIVAPPKSEISIPQGQGTASVLKATVEKHPSVSGFLQAAEDSLIAHSENITQKIGLEAIDLAAKRKASAVDVPDIISAGEKLYPDKNLSEHSWQWGLIGILAGAAISFLITLLAPSIAKDNLIFGVSIAVFILVGVTAWGIRLILQKPH